MRRLLIVGCGDVVRRALPQLLRRWRVYALVRRHDSRLADQGVVQIVGDLDRRDSLRRLAGLADAVIPPSDSQALHAAAQGRAELWSLPGIGHDDWWRHPQFTARVAEFLAR